jgi:hypothetical protein
MWRGSQRLADAHSSFPQHAERRATIHHVEVRTILVELARHHMVRGQEDVIVGVALDLLAKSRSERHAAQKGGKKITATHRALQSVASTS